MSWTPSERLFNGEIVSSTVGYGLVSAVVVAVLGLFAGTRAMRRD
jgi:ABC-2 type transport system permease protein